MGHLFKNFKLFSSPTRVISLSFAAVILIGTLLLMLPVSARTGSITPFLDCLFTATSATCVTGLVVYDTYLHWTGFGQFIILMLIQIGGLGLVTFTTFFNIVIGKKLGLRSMHLAQESVNTTESDIGTLIGMVIKTALLVEGMGAILMSVVFVPQYGAQGIWISIFISISAFCNAGFDIFGRESAFISLCNYADNPIIIGVVSALIIIGGIGFIVIYDLVHFKKSMRLTLHTKVVLLTTTILLILGTILTAISEWSNPITMGAFTGAEKLGAAWFHSVSSRTAGFNTFDMGGMRDVTKLFSTALMFIGAAPGSTGGGIKCTTIAVIFMTVRCVIWGREETVLFRRRVDKSAVYKSMAVTVLGLAAVLVTAGCIVATMRLSHEATWIDALFESVSAFATVGLSVGVTGNAKPLAKILLLFSMYIGRLGPVTFFLSLAMRANPSRKEIMPEGKIQIG